MDERKVDLVREVPEYSYRDDGDTPQRRYNEPHEFLHHRPDVPGHFRI